MTTYDRIVQKNRNEGKIEGKIEGRNEGRNEGVQIGIQKGKIEVVLNCFDQDVPMPMIINIAGLSEADVIKHTQGAQ